MRKVREVLRLKHALGMSYRKISEATGAGKTQAAEYVRRAQAAGASASNTAFTARFSWVFALARDLTFAAGFLLPAFPFFLAISVSLPMMIPHDGTWPKSGYSASCVAGPSMRDGGGTQ